MQAANIAKLLRLLGATVSTSSRSGWVISECPLGPWNHEGGKSGDSVFGVKVENGDCKCNCFSCGYHGNLSTLILDMRHFNKQAPHATYDFKTCFDMVSDAESEMDLSFLDSPVIGDDAYSSGETALTNFPRRG